jgi:hypothetical protein
MTDEKADLAGRILDMLRDVELLVAELYRRFARFFPKDRELWESLSADEEGHAAAAAELKGLLAPDRAPSIHERVNLAALGTYKKGLEYHFHRLERGEINRTKALFTARDIERTLVEKAFYELVQSEDPNYRAGQARVDGETKSHLEKLEAYIAALDREPAGR